MKLKKIISVISAAVIAASAASVSAVPVSAADDASGWQSYYSRYLKKLAKDNENSPKSFSINDLDDNGTPELIICLGDCHATGCEIYTCKSGKLKRLGIVGSNGEFDYDPENNIIDSNYSGQGSVYSTFYKLKNGKMSKMISFYNFEGFGEKSFSINEKDVSEATFEKYSDKYAMKNRVTIGRAFSLTDTSIDLAINGGKNYKQVYKKFLKQYVNTEYVNKFIVKDITGDKIPELILSLNETDNYIYTYTDNRLCHIGHNYCKAPSIGYCRSKKTLVFTATDDSGSFSKCFYTFKDNYLLNSTTLTKNTYSSDDESTSYYFYNNYSITASEYNKYLKKYNKMKFASLSKSYTVTENNINEILK